MGKTNIFFRYGCLAGLALLLLAACHQGTRRPETTPRSDSVFHSGMLKDLTDSIGRFPDSSRLYFERGGRLYVMKEYELAGKDIQKAIDLDPMKTDYYIALGEIQLSGGKTGEAAKAYRRALVLAPDNLMARLQLSYVLFQQKHYGLVVHQTDTLLLQDPKMAQAYGLQSQAYQALQDTARALRVMRKAVKLAPANYDALMAMGDLLLKGGDSAALTYYRRAAKADTTQGEPLYGMGLFYQRQSRPGEAISAYKACIGRDAYYLDAYLKLGGIYENENAWKKALKIYNLAIQVSPASSDVFYHRGRCYEKLHHPKAAISDYENALDLKDTNGDARQALNRLKENHSNT
jgi:tetratricopeptide (TPR) repeat protein